jgi:hypothetical protein
VSARAIELLLCCRRSYGLVALQVCGSEVIAISAAIVRALLTIRWSLAVA